MNELKIRELRRQLPAKVLKPIEGKQSAAGKTRNSSQNPRGSTALPDL